MALTETLHIDFERQITEIRFERLCARYYARSLQRKIKSIVFDWKSVEWCDPFPLSLCVLWVGELLLQGKHVDFELPSQQLQPADGDDELQRRLHLDRRIRVYSYLSECLVIRYLVDSGILQKDTLRSFQALRREKALEARISPLTFLSVSRDLDSFLATTSAQHTFEFGPMLNLAVVRTGEIRTVILRELGDNILDHAAGRLGHLIMSYRDDLKISGGDAERLLEVRALGALATERRFFETLGSAGYATVIVSDKGPGIATTLRLAYDEDDIIKNKSAEPTSVDLVHYAFLRHSTSKHASTRLRDFQSLIEQYQLPSDPATGLQWVREVVKSYRGLLTVRTDDVLVTYDFLNHPETGHPASGIMSNRMDRRLRALARFGGVQMKLLFPARVPTRQLAQQFFLSPIAIPKDDRRYSYLGLAPTTNDAVREEPSYLASWLSDNLKALHRLALAQPPLTIIVDCDGSLASKLGV
jgi:hypothetical protein